MPFTFYAAFFPLFTSFGFRKIWKAIKQSLQFSYSYHYHPSEASWLWADFCPLLTTYHLLTTTTTTTWTTTLLATDGLVSWCSLSYNMLAKEYLGRYETEWDDGGSGSRRYIGKSIRGPIDGHALSHGWILNPEARRRRSTFSFLHAVRRPTDTDGSWLHELQAAGNQENLPSSACLASSMTFTM